MQTIKNDVHSFLPNKTISIQALQYDVDAVFACNLNYFNSNITMWCWCSFCN